MDSIMQHTTVRYGLMKRHVGCVAYLIRLQEYFKISSSSHHSGFLEGSRESLHKGLSTLASPCTHATKRRPEGRHEALADYAKSTLIIAPGCTV